MSFCLPLPLYFGEKGVMLCLYRLLPVVKAGENVLFSCIHLASMSQSIDPFQNPRRCYTQPFCVHRVC